MSTDFPEELREILINFYPQLIEFKTEITGKDITIFLGNTRCGKSSLVNYLIGTELVAYEKRRLDIKIKKKNENADGPAIGAGSLSCTNIPKLYVSPDYGLIVDAPGFKDNRSYSQDILNSLYISQIKHTKSVRIVLVVDINDIFTDNIKSFISLINTACTLISNSSKLQSATSVIFTKDFRNYTQEEMAELIRTKIADLKLSDAEPLLNHIIHNYQLIGSFRMPESVGDLTSNVDFNIKSAILASTPMKLNYGDVKVALSEHAQNKLLQCYQQYLNRSYFTKQLEQIAAGYEDYFDEDYIFASTNDELQDVKPTMNPKLALLKNEMEISFKNLKEIDASLNRIFVGNMEPDFLNSFNMLVKLGELSVMNENIRNRFVENYKEALHSVVKDIDELMNVVEKEINSREFSNADGYVAIGAGVVATLGRLGLIGITIGSVAAVVAMVRNVMRENKVESRKKLRQEQGRSVVSDDMLR